MSVDGSCDGLSEDDRIGANEAAHSVTVRGELDSDFGGDDDLHRGFDAVLNRLDELPDPPPAVRSPSQASSEDWEAAAFNASSTAAGSSELPIAPASTSVSSDHAAQLARGRGKKIM